MWKCQIHVLYVYCADFNIGVYLREKVSAKVQGSLVGIIFD